MTAESRSMTVLLRLAPSAAATLGSRLANRLRSSDAGVADATARELALLRRRRTFFRDA